MFKNKNSVLIKNFAAVLFLVTLLITAAAERAGAAVIVEFTSGIAGASSQRGGQSLTTPTGGPWNNLSFNFFSNVPAVTASAAGQLFLLTQEYLGAPVALGLATPGFLAQSTSISGGEWFFDPTVTILPNIQYFFYADSSTLVSGANSNVYSGGNFYDGNGAVFVSLPSLDANFRLSGLVATPSSPVPELDATSGTGAISLLLGMLALLGERRRKRSLDRVPC